MHVQLCLYKESQDARQCVSKLSQIQSPSQRSRIKVKGKQQPKCQSTKHDGKKAHNIRSCCWRTNDAILSSMDKTQRPSKISQTKISYTWTKISCTCTGSGTSTRTRIQTSSGSYLCRQSCYPDCRSVPSLYRRQHMYWLFYYRQVRNHF